MLHNVDRWSQYVRRITSGLTQAQIAERTGIAQTNISRWLRGDPLLPKAENVITFARAFGHPPLEALIAAGYLTEEDGAPVLGQQPSVSMFSTEELFAELQSRIRD